MPLPYMHAKRCGGLPWLEGWRWKLNKEGFVSVDGAEIRLTSWYGETTSIHVILYIPGDCLGFLNHQQYWD